jgi:hypothetical protein
LLATAPDRGFAAALGVTATFGTGSRVIRAISWSHCATVSSPLTTGSEGALRHAPAECPTLGTLAVAPSRFDSASTPCGCSATLS